MDVIRSSTGLVSSHTIVGYDATVLQGSLVVSQPNPRAAAMAVMMVRSAGRVCLAAVETKC